MQIMSYAPTKILAHSNTISILISRKQNIFAKRDGTRNIMREEDARKENNGQK